MSRSPARSGDAPLLVLLLAGGGDAEADVSRSGAAEVAATLAAEPGVRVRFVDLASNDARAVRDAVAAERPDVVLPLVHGPWGEGGPLQAILTDAHVAYVGPPAAVAAAAMDKAVTKAAAAAAGVATIEGGVVGRGDPAPVPPPAVVKPVDDGSSIELFLAEDAAGLAAAIDRVTRARGRALVERRIVGRELTVGLLAGEPLPLVEIVPAGPLYDYHAKYAASDTDYRCPPPELDPAVAAAAVAAALTMWRTMGLRDLARVDFILDGAVPRLLEVNTMPGFTARSLFPRAAAAAGLPLGPLAARLVRGAAARGPATG